LKRERPGRYARRIGGSLPTNQKAASLPNQEGGFFGKREKEVSGPIKRGFLYQVKIGMSFLTNHLKGGFRNYKRNRSSFTKHNKEVSLLTNQGKRVPLPKTQKRGSLAPKKGVLRVQALNKGFLG
jgi:hypothetical protein